MLSLLPTPFWDTNTQMTAAGIEPTGLAVKRTFGKKLRRPKQPANLSLLSKRPKPQKYNKSYKGDINERNRGKDSNPQCPLRHPDFRYLSFQFLTLPF